jgi:hypothetical protein
MIFQKQEQITKKNSDGLFSELIRDILKCEKIVKNSD